jgi:hypothetical protein
LPAMTSINRPNSYEHSQPSRSHRIKEIARRTLLKQYAITPVTKHHSLPPEQHITPVRPKMGMKDSDDYITARAANPRTGLISPSLAGTPRTPESPAEALKPARTRLVRSVLVAYRNYAAARRAGLSRTPNPGLPRPGQAMRVLALQTSLALNHRREQAQAETIDSWSTCLPHANLSHTLSQDEVHKRSRLSSTIKERRERPVAKAGTRDACKVAAYERAR